MATDQAVFTQTAALATPPALHPKPPKPSSVTGMLASEAKAFRNRIGLHLNVAGLESTDFTVISNDCWGQALYEELGLPSKTPLIGSGMHADCFLRFLGDVPGYLGSPLRFIRATRYASGNRIRQRRPLWPIGLLGDDVEIHFLHYTKEDEAREVWEDGCRRVNLNRLAIKFTVDKDGASQDHVTRFGQMRFERKLLLSKREHPEIDCAVRVPNYVLNGAMMFRRSLRQFDCAHWLNTGEIKRSTPRVLVNKVLYARGV